MNISSILNELDNLVIDKQIDDIAYSDEKHIYFDVTTKERYTSVTTLIGKYQPQFDEIFMSRKCAERDIRKGWTKLSVTERQQELLAQWKEKNVTVSDNGTRLHLMIEEFLMGVNSYEESIRKYNLTAQEVTYLDYVISLNFHDYDLLICEDLLYNKKYKRAGQSDIVTIHQGRINIDDWKFNSKPLTWEGYNGQKMLYPLHHLQSSKLHTYQLQTSIYMYFKCLATGLKPGHIRIHHFLDGVITPFEFEYLEEEVYTLLEYDFNKNKIKKYGNIDLFIGRKSFNAGGELLEIVKKYEDDTYDVRIGKNTIVNDLYEDDVRELMSLPQPIR